MNIRGEVSGEASGRHGALHAALHDLVCRFQSAFDEHDWDGLERCLADPVFTDYSSFRGTPPATVARADYVAQRRAALSTLRMQHNFSNLRVEALAGDDEDRRAARGTCNYAILRFAAPAVNDTNEAVPFFHSYGRYVFDFRCEPERGWVIAGITQLLLENVGDPTIHAGARAR